MNFSQLRLVINNSVFVKFFSESSKQSNLGRWAIKDHSQIEYFMTKMHADPGYQFLHNVNRIRDEKPKIKN